MRVLLALALLGVPTFADDREPEAEPRKGVVEWTDGDYGPVVSTHMDAGGGAHGDTRILTGDALSNFVFRGRLISVNAEKSVNVCFDTELMRVAAAWTGGYVEWEGAFKNQGPAIKGDVLFSTNREPGWSRGDDWADPRDPVEGPLPKDWAHYKGLYRHGDKVILSYTVGDVAVLEMPAIKVGRDGGTTILRHFTVGPSKEPMGLLCWNDGGVTATPIAGKRADVRHENGRTRIIIPPRATRTSFVIGKKEPGKSAFIPRVLNLHEFTNGGPPIWTETVETASERAEDDAAYVVDDIPLPDDNPWKSKLRLGAVDFFADGRAAVSTWDGDVWIVDGLDREDGKVTWRRFATGLHQPLGLKIVDGIIHTAGRDQITRLHDLNDDGEADFYENFNNDAGLTPQRHEYVLDLRTDDAGNFYYCRSGHYMPSQRGENCCIMRLPPDGSKLEVYARGLREPNGMSLAPADGPYVGLMTVGDNEGNGIPQTPIHAVSRGEYLGFPNAILKEERRALRPAKQPIVWLPKSVDQSAGAQIWVTSDKWGPLEGHLLHTSYGNCKLFHLMLDRVDSTWQGGVVEFPLRFTSGIMRGRFRNQDGQLYLCGLRGWGTSAATEGQLCRVRYTGREFRQPLAFRATPDGVSLTFATKLDAETAADEQNWAVESQGVTDKKPLELFVDGLELSKDGKTISLVLEESEPVEMLTIEYRIRAADGTELNGKVHATINAVPGG